jgi:hypothetical protein
VAAKRQTVLRVCVERLGVHRGALAAANVAQLAMATHDLGHVPTGVEYSEYWSVSDRTAWYHRSRVRDALGDDWEAFVVQLARAVGDARTPRAVTQLPAPRLVSA